MMPSIFSTYLQQTRHVVLYRLPATIRPCAIFPQATTVALIDCEPDAIPRVLGRTRFPRLQTIHYLSGHPGRVDLYREMKGCHWVFPNQDYGFYQCMIEGGWGRADPRLISTYIDQVHGMGVDLRLPGLGVYPGVSRYMKETGSYVIGYRWHLLEHLHTPYRPIQGVWADALEVLQDAREGWSETVRDREFMEMMLREPKK